jgi:hypothetical protein
MADYRKQRKRKRIVLSALLTLVTDDTIFALAFSPVQPRANGCDRYVCTEKFSHPQFHREQISCRSRNLRKALRMNDSTGDNLVGEDQSGHATTPLPDLIMIRSELALWSTQQLLSALNERMIRYAPTASRTDLENILVEYLRNNHDSIDLDDKNNGPQVISTDVKPPQLNLLIEGYSNRDNNVLEERLHKRLQRRIQQQTRQDRFRKSTSNFLYSVVPSVTGNILDYTKRRARRLKRHIADFMLLDEETGIRDVVRYDYVRREQTRSAYALESEVVLGPGDAIEVIVNDTPTQQLPSDAKVRASSNYCYDSSSVNLNSSPILEESHVTDSSSRFRLPPGSSDSGASSSSSNFATPPKRKRKNQNTHDKKVYNPYGRGGRDILDDDKDAIDRVADFLANTADQIFDRILVTGNNVVDNYQADADTTTRSADAQRPLDGTATKRSSHQPRNNNNNKKNRTRRKHWKDRLEERLDSMLGLHESGDFYRSWTERDERNKVGDDEPFDAFSVAQGRKPQKRRGKSRYDKPFWEEDGNIFSLLFGRTQHFTPPRWDFRLGSQTGSLLSIFRFALQNFLIIASYLCRWASTQGALPQPVVVLGVGSAMLCARPHRRLFSAGIALLILRTVGEVLHGYVYGNSGWDDEYDETTALDKEKADMEQYDEEF